MPSQDTPACIKIGLAQIGAITFHRRVGQQWFIHNGFPRLRPPRTEQKDFVYLPYSVGLLQAHIEKHAQNSDRYQFLPFVYHPIPIDEGAERFKSADIVGFSAYIWNEKLSLAIAKKLKEINPEVTIIFGGPQVPDRSAAWLREHPYVDIAVHGAGEEIFLELVENYPNQQLDHIQSLSFLREDGSYVQTMRAPRRRDIERIPSPYLEGTFDQLMQDNPHHHWMVMWETNRGCPFSCTFCDWGSAVASKVYRFGMDRLYAEIDWLVENKIPHLFCCDANFGIFPRDLDIATRIVEYSKTHGYPRFFNVQNSKNATERTYKIQKLLNEMASVGATLSMQSLDSNTLVNIKRDNISLDSFLELSRRYRRDKIKTYTDILIGLPGETYNTFTDGLSNLMRNGQHNNIKFYNTSILPNAEMGDPAYQAMFGMETVPIRIIHHHDSIEDIEAWEVYETINVVVGTKSMPKPEWVRARAFVWMLELLHFGRMLQIVFVTLTQKYDVTYRALVEQFMDVDNEQYPTLGIVRDMFVKQAQIMQAGGDEFKPSEEWLGVWWPIEHYALVWLVAEKKLSDFYAEANTLLGNFVRAERGHLNQQLLDEAIKLNQGLMTIPFKLSDLKVKLSYNIWEYYQAVIAGEPIPLDNQPITYKIDRTSRLWLTLEGWLCDLLPRTDAKHLYFYPLKSMPSPAPSINGKHKHAELVTA